jgi:hypothetical protein
MTLTNSAPAVRGRRDRRTMPNFNQQELFALDPRREHARALRRAGHTVPEIRELLDLESNYRAHLLVADIPTSTNPRLRARAKDRERARARELRLQGWTYDEIAAELSVSKASCSIWCRDLPLPRRTPRPRRPDWRPYRARRDQERDALKVASAAEVGAVSACELFLLGVALYWAEGTKDKPYDRRETVTFTNSDPDVITVFMAWLALIGVRPDGCGFRVHIHETADAVAAVAYWADVIGVDPARFSRTTLKRHNPRTNRQNRRDGYHGCLVVTVRRSAYLYRQVEGWWRGISGAVLVAGPLDGTMDVNNPGSSKGRTEIFGVSNGGSNPPPGAAGFPPMTGSLSHILGMTPSSLPRRQREPGAPPA